MKHSLIVGLVSICMLFVHPAFAQTQSFEQWLAEFQIDAKARGISDKIFDEALGNAKPIPRVIELDRNQPEFKNRNQPKSNRNQPKSYGPRAQPSLRARTRLGLT